ncbi:MAG: hypothetical protein RIM99_09480 [Cyclobacteriaceae bacterium]
MADENKNENEEQDDFFGDDEDFGLPDLEYEVLGDDGDKADEPADDEVSDPFGDEEKEEETPADEPEPDSEPTAEADDDFGAGLDLDAEFDSEPDTASDSSDSSESSDDLGDDFYSEDDFGDFDASDIDLDEEIPDSVFDSDVLDDDEFKDFESEMETTASESKSAAPATTFSKDEAKASRGKFTKIVIFGTILFIALGSIFWYAYNNWGEDKPKEVAKKVTPKKAPAKKPTPEAEKPAENTDADTAKKNETPARNNASTRPAATTPAKTSVAATPGTINRIEERTGNSFIIIGSFVDGDIAMDYANKLAGEGKSPSIIPPYGNGLFHRVAIAGFPTVASAIQNLDSYKGEYGDDVWVLKY